MTKRKVHQAEKNVLYLIARVERAMHLRLDRDLQPLGLAITSYSVLRLLAYEPHLSASDIARRTLISQQAASRLIQRMTKMHLIMRKETDGRVQRLAVADAGAEALALADPVVAAWEDRVRETFKVIEFKVFTAHLNRILKIFS